MLPSEAVVQLFEGQSTPGACHGLLDGLIESDAEAAEQALPMKTCRARDVRREVSPELRVFGCQGGGHQTSGRGAGEVSDGSRDDR